MPNLAGPTAVCVLFFSCASVHRGDSAQREKGPASTSAPLMGDFSLVATARVWMRDPDRFQAQIDALDLRGLEAVEVWVAESILDDSDSSLLLPLEDEGLYSVAGWSPAPNLLDTGAYVAICVRNPVTIGQFSPIKSHERLSGALWERGIPHGWDSGLALWVPDAIAERSISVLAKEFGGAVTDELRVRR